jgi:hypothetical protein
MLGVLGDLTMIWIPCWSLLLRPLYDLAGVKNRLPGIMNVDSSILDFLLFLTAIAAHATAARSATRPKQPRVMASPGEK